MGGKSDLQRTRRTFLVRGGALLTAALTGPAAWAAETAAITAAPVSPVEDLMREHGLLDRVILIYSELRGRLAREREVPPEAVTGATEIIKSFIEDYHEKLEESFVFPRFEKAGQQVELVKTLREQHDEGRRLTGLIRGSVTEQALDDTRGRRELSGRMYAFNRMYRPHKAREDTVLFPALHALVSASEYDALGDQFEQRERELFGEGGFEKMVGKVADLERSLDIYDLSEFTPQVQLDGASKA